jgi:7-carboxy-7-deazaguanine synthase
VAAVCAKVTEYNISTILVTGGEPLLQPEVIPLLQELLALGNEVILETSGTKGGLSLTTVPAGVHRVVDIKTPGSGIPDVEIDWAGIGTLGPQDEIKIVCCHRADYEWARHLLQEKQSLPADTPVLFTAAYGQLDPARLAQWILADRLVVRLQIQLHKVLWPGRERGI